MINGGSWYGPDVPFGGYKTSGLGRENGAAGFEARDRVRHVPSRRRRNVHDIQACVGNELLIGGMEPRAVDTEIVRKARVRIGMMVCILWRAFSPRALDSLGVTPQLRR